MIWEAIGISIVGIGDDVTGIVKMSVAFEDNPTHVSVMRLLLSPSSACGILENKREVDEKFIQGCRPAALYVRQGLKPPALALELAASEKVNSENDQEYNIPTRAIGGY
jgi:hypothetical protein